MIMVDEGRFIVAVDIGTTTIRACLYNIYGHIIHSAAQPMQVLIRGEEETTVEIDPAHLWRQFLLVVKEAISRVPSHATVSMGICTQRNSFISWHKDSLQPCGNFICWNDCRSRKKCEEWNKSWSLKMLHLGGGILHWMTRRPRFRAARMLKFLGSMVSFRLLVQLEQNEEMRQLLQQEKLSTGCIDTWLIARLSKGKIITTEPSNVSATGLFDPFINDYNRTILSLICFPQSQLNPVRDTASTGQPFAVIDESLFGRSIDVCAVMADQQAALFGCGGWTRGDTMISMGTGTFVQKNLDKQPHASMGGLYPLVGWRINGRTTYIAEGQDHDTSLTLNWAHSIGLFDDVSETSAIANSTRSSDGVYFVPAFGGLQTPCNDDSACCGFLGLRPSSTKAQMVRALLEAICFRVHEITHTMHQEIHFKNQSHIRICGGISANDFVCQTIATLINRPIERLSDASFAAARGVALMTGIAQGIWRADDINNMVAIERVFHPRSEDRPSLLRTFHGWQKAVKRCQKFYD